jgi:hypothetical protein
MPLFKTFYVTFAAVSVVIIGLLLTFLWMIAQ